MRSVPRVVTTGSRRSKVIRDRKDEIRWAGINVTERDP